MKKSTALMIGMAAMIGGGFGVLAEPQSRKSDLCKCGHAYDKHTSVNTCTACLCKKFTKIIAEEPKD